MALSNKTLLKTLTAIFACILLVYTSCKKTNITQTNKSPTQTAPKTEDIAKQLAMNFYKSFTGGNGGVNINDGIKPTLNITTDKSKNVLNSTQNALCGYTIDTTYNSASKDGDTTATSSGEFKFIYTCSASDVNGYKSTVSNNSNVTDSVTFRSTNSISQNYVVTATDNTYKTVLTNGTINTESNYSILGINGSTAGFYFISAQYTMANVKVDISSGIADAVSGSATFNSLVINEPPTTPQTDGNFYSYTGNINYLGNHMAWVSIQLGNGQYNTYLVNMLTGATTAQ